MLMIRLKQGTLEQYAAVRLLKSLMTTSKGDSGWTDEDNKFKRIMFLSFYHFFQYN